MLNVELFSLHLANEYTYIFPDLHTDEFVLLFYIPLLDNFIRSLTGTDEGISSRV